MLAEGCCKKTESKLSDWRNDKIVVSESYGSDWSSSIVENERYIFYITTDYVITRFDKDKQQKKQIINIGKQEDAFFLSLEVAGDRLYYLVENVLYQSDLNGKNRKIICSGEDIKDPPYDYVSWIYAVHIEKDDIYLKLQGNEIGRLDKDKKEIHVITEDVDSECCFYKGALFYRNRYDFVIYRQDLQTLQIDVVRGKEWSEQTKDSETSKQCRQVFTVGDRLYYTCDQEGTKAKLYQYSEDGKDEVKFEDDKSGNKLQGMVTDTSKRIYDYYYSETDKAFRLRIIDPEAEKVEKSGLLENFAYEGQVIDGTYLYVSRDHRDVYSMLKLK